MGLYGLLVLILVALDLAHFYRTQRCALGRRLLRAPYLPCRRRSPPPVRRRAATAAIAATAERCARRAALRLPGQSAGRSESGRSHRARCGSAWCTWT